MRVSRKIRNKTTECIDYEIEKIFRIEPQAMKQDFDLGNRKIIIPVDEFRYIEHQCRSSAEYIRYQMVLYVGAMRSRVLEKINKNDRLAKMADTLIRDSISRHGTNVFGKNTNRQFEAAVGEIAMLMFSKKKCLYQV